MAPCELSGTVWYLVGIRDASWKPAFRTLLYQRQFNTYAQSRASRPRGEHFGPAYQYDIWCVWRLAVNLVFMAFPIDCLQRLFLVPTYHCTNWILHPSFPSSSFTIISSCEILWRRNGLTNHIYSFISLIHIFNSFVDPSVHGNLRYRKIR